MQYNDERQVGLHIFMLTTTQLVVQYNNMAPVLKDEFIEVALIANGVQTTIQLL